MSQLKRKMAEEYSSVICSILLAQALEDDPALVNYAISGTALRCMARVTTLDVLKILQHIGMSPNPSKTMVDQVRGIEASGKPLMEFLAVATSLTVAGVR